MGVSIPESAQTHFKCAFDISGNNQDLSSDNYFAVTSAIKTWVERKFNRRIRIPDWFYSGNSDQISLKDNAAIRIERETGSYSDDFPEYWVCELIHVDKESNCRFWSIELGIQRKERILAFAVMLKHWIRENYIGETPPLPTSSSPKVVSDILNITGIVCAKDGLPLLPIPFCIEKHNIQEIIEDVFSVNRKYPIIVSAPKGPVSHITDLEQIAKNVAGNALVIQLSSFEMLAQLNKAMGSGFECRPGSIRIFAPGISKTNPNEGYRHRFFVDGNYSREDLCEIITTGISRNYKTFHPNQVYSIGDVHELRNRLEFHKKLEAAKNSIDKDLLEEIEIKYSKLLSEKKSLEAQLYEEQVKTMGLNDDVDEFARTKKYLESTISDLNRQIGQTSKPNEIMPLFSSLPSNSSEALEKIEKMFSTRVSSIPRAKKTAEEFETHSLNLISEIWSALFHISTTLWDLIFIQNDGDIENEFRLKTTFELAMTEGKMTKSDKSLMEKRKEFFNGRNIDITPHVKYGNREPRMFRIYFCVDNDERKLIFGQIGEHIDNYTTKKLK